MNRPGDRRRCEPCSSRTTYAYRTFGMPPRGLAYMMAQPVPGLGSIAVGLTSMLGAAVAWPFRGRRSGSEKPVKAAPPLVVAAPSASSIPGMPAGSLSSKPHPALEMMVPAKPRD